MKPYAYALKIFKTAAVGFIIALLGCSPEMEYSPTPILTTNFENAECSHPETTMPQPNVPESYIGKVFDPLRLPEGLDFIFGSLMEESEFTLVQIAVPSKSMQILWLAEIKCKNYYVHDVLVLPALNPYDMLVTDYCRFHGEEDPELLAVGEFEFGMISLKTIDHVWRANRELKKFEELSADGIECWRAIGTTSP
jgi:hypothetical protein